MEFYIGNLRVKQNSLTESYFDSVLKEAAFASKVRDGMNAHYSLVLIPKVEEDQPENLREEISAFVTTTLKEESEAVLRSVISMFRGNWSTKNISEGIFDVFSKIKDDDLDIFYSDGSFNQKTGESSFAVCKLNEEAEKGTEDSFSKKKFLYETFTGVIEDSTNNVGELSGIKKVSENFGDKQIQLVISDSEYSIKAFREWIHNWKNNGYKTYSKKPILNQDLIKTTHEQLVKDRSKLVLFKWTKGHVGDAFNEICDKNAKDVLGISK